MQQRHHLNGNLPHQENLGKCAGERGDDMWQAIPPTIGEEEIEVHHRATKQENHPADNSLFGHTKAAGEDPPEQDNQPSNQEDGSGKRRLQALHVMRVIALKNENVPAE